jgi:AmmeMemoRadiSam system protein B
MTAHRPAAVAGLFYPADPVLLATEVGSLLRAAPVGNLPEAPIKALIAPHAGYVYSGPIAATAYAALVPIASRIRRVVLLGPAHRVAVQGLAMPAVDAFETPLGNVPLDVAAMQALTRFPQVSIHAAAHEREHALEVQLPFLQSVLGEFTLLPLLVGRATAEQVAEVLEAIWGDDDTLIVISSDLSHYLPAADARHLDGRTARSILQLQGGLDHAQACGATPVNGLLLAARRHHLTPHLLDLRNSGDTAGSRDAVVGYAAFAFTAGGEHV